MYTPKNFREDDIATLHDHIQAYSFAMLLTGHAGLPQISHLPFLLDEGRGPYGTLIAHMARANPQWQAFDANREVAVVFQGPHTYISPSWYAASDTNVPTWNYTVVHAYGKPQIIEDDAVVYQILQDLVRKFEANFEKPWEYCVPAESLPQRLRGIVAFEIEITRLEGKFKLSQNRTSDDRLRVIAALQESGDAHDVEVATLMQQVAYERSRG